MLQFCKMNGAGNDFIIIDNRALKIKLGREEISRLCDRHRGIGADGLLLVEPASAGADFRMRYYNSDGGEAEMCGNGARCFARFADKIAGPFSHLRFETLAGVINARLEANAVTLRLSPPEQARFGRTLEISGKKLVVHSINTGVPHVVTFVEELESTPIVSWGAQIRHHAAFQPAGTNVNFAQVLKAGRIAIRTYERGVEAETLACGTGVTASALIYAGLEKAASPIQVVVRGGDLLEVGFAWTGTNFTDVTLKGPAEFSFEGSIQTP